jgi:kumamolisin
LSATSHFASQRRVPLPGSDRLPFRPTGLAPSSPAKYPSRERLTVSVIVQPKQPLDPQNIAIPDARLSPEQYAERHGPHPDSVRLIHAFADEFGLSAKEADRPGRCTMHLTGTVSAMETAFGVSLSEQEVNGETCRVREGEIQLPEELSGHIVAVLGLDNRPQAKPHFRIATPHASNISYTPVQIAQLYGFPAGATAKGQTIGIIELGGGFRQADLTAFFKTLGLPTPAVETILVDGGKNAPGTADGPDGEVMLDIEVCAAVAPGANIAVYFAPNTDQGFVDAISTAVHDTANKPSVISISWGGPESSWTSQAMTALDSACQAAAVLGVTIVVACGDNGSTDGVAGSANHVDFPASSPHVLACGGTTLKGTGSVIATEVVWNETAVNEGATGGGVSAVFPLPSWQSSANVPAPATSTGGRGVPDVAGDADPSTGYTVRVDGQTMVIGGTSAVAPLWAGLIALANAHNRSSSGFVNPTLYASSATRAFRDITQGNNGGFSARPGWDACSGLGTPVGTLVIAALGSPPGTA